MPRSIRVQFSESNSMSRREHLRMTEFYRMSVNQPVVGSEMSVPHGKYGRFPDRGCERALDIVMGKNLHDWNADGQHRAVQQAVNAL